MRSQGDGKGIQLTAPLKLSLERALEYIDVDEYVEATPKNLRLRKKILNETARKRSEKTRSIKILSEYEAVAAQLVAKGYTLAPSEAGRGRDFAEHLQRA
jgi:hypothetical protein